MYELIKKRVFIVCGLATVFAMCITLVELLFFGTTNFTHALLFSPVFAIIFYLLLWFFGPKIIDSTGIDTEQNVRPHTVLILGGGLLIIFITVAFIWLISL
jgi:hypothetical protein